MSFSWNDRDEALASLAANPPELLIIGAGIVGASTAAHAAHLGLNVLLVEKDDIAAGASGNSTGLAHAGLRYLAQGRIGYVFREGRERRRLQELAPQWVRPFNFVLPAYKNDPFPFWVVRFGTWIYDLLGWIDALLTKTPLVKRHRILSANEIKAKAPGIRTEDLLGGIEYYVDAKLQDSRFTLGYAQQASEHGARVLTHCKVVLMDAANQNPRVTLEDNLSGKRYEVTASLILNTSGAWIDEVRQMTGFSKKVVQASRGVHLIVDHIADDPFILSASTKGKVFFVIPIDSERTLVGTTDTPSSEAPDRVTADSKDVSELLHQLFYYFPYLKNGPNLQEAIDNYKNVHVRDIFWGIRPLLAQAGSTLHASREHKLVKDLPRFWSFPGVKLTAGRAAGEEAATDAWRFIRKEAPLPKVFWDSLPGGDLWSMDRFVSDAQKRFKLGADSRALLQYLIDMYGTRYVEVLKWAQSESHLGTPIVPGEPWILAQVAYAVREEMVLTLNDFLWRRTKWAHYRDLPEDVIRAIAGILGETLAWSDEELATQIKSYETERGKHRL